MSTSTHNQTPSTAASSSAVEVDWIEEVVATLDPLNTLDQVAAALKIHKRSVQRRIASGELKACRMGLGSSRTVIARQSVAAFLRGLEG